MKKPSIFFALLFIVSTSAFSTTHTIISSGFTFSPDSISATVGDTVIFSLAPFHSVVEVYDTTWAANHNTSNGGFQLPLGGGMIVVSQAKTYYYVCGVHYAMGMKGRLFVSSGAGISSIPDESQAFEITPNPSHDKVTIRTNLAAGKKTQLRILDDSGKVLLVKENISQVENLDLSAFPAGTYFVEIKSGSQLLKKKLVRSK